MTIGQRIAQKRKEKNLSQEALGEQVGVSRQAIYKWESDASVPEIDKLVALSRLFGVTVGVLLGVEEPPMDCEAESPDTRRGELSDAQLKMVEEITRGYLAAQPAPKRIAKGWIVLAVLLVIFGAWKLFGRLDTIDRNYDMLGSTVSSMRDTLSSRIFNLTDQVQEILEKQNSLVADYGTEIVSTNLKENRVVFSVYAMPKTYTENMTAVFTADNGTGGIQNIEGELGHDQKYTAAVACELTDKITLSVAFISTDGTRQTQLLETYEDLYSQSVPWVDIRDYGDIMGLSPQADGSFLISGLYLSAGECDNGYSGEISLTAKISTVQVGLFRNKKLINWAIPCEKPESYQGDYGNTSFYLLPDTTVSLGSGDVLEFAAIVTDEYGRKSVSGGMPPYVLNSDGSSLTWPDSSSFDSDLSHWSV